MATSRCSSKMKLNQVIVIGAGIAGLHCAELLHNAGVPVVVLEAGSTIGGRVKEVQFVDWKDVDIGADFLHGRNTVLGKYIDHCGFPVRKVFTWAQGDSPAPPYHIGGGAGMYYLGLKKELVRWDTSDPDVTTVNNLLWTIGDLDLKPDENRSIEQYLRENGVSEEGIGLAEAGYANTMCSSIDRLPLAAVLHLENAWSRDGEGLFRLDHGLLPVLAHMARNLNVHTECEVNNIDYSGENVIVRCSNGQVFEGAQVVCTVPLNVLKSGVISFKPDLPREHKLALDTFKMYAALKVLIEFSARFWPKELHGVICGNCLIPEFWFEQADRVGGLVPESSVVEKVVEYKKPTYLVVGYACAKSAEKLSQMKKEEVVQKAVEQLNEIFGGKSVNDALLDKRPAALLERSVAIETVVNPPNPASLYYMDSMVVDWGKNSLIRGGYSSPSFGETPEMRSLWSRPVNSKLYFAGEAFNRDSIMTLHGAMETGIVAAEGILKSVGAKAKL